MTDGYRSLVEHYERCLAEHGDSHLGVDWPNARDAETRYRVMLDVMGVTERPVSLLDFGCGAGHLYEYLTGQGRTEIAYSGVDASPRFVELCRSKFPHVSFHCVDVLTNDVELPEVDYIVMNGVLTEKRGLAFDEMRQYMEQLLARVFRSARIGLSFNVMSAHVDWQRDDLFHVPYDMLATFLRAQISRHFVFRADYGLYEYTTYVYREPR
jgi:SAM-dependent methyltransferase